MALGTLLAFFLVPHFAIASRHGGTVAVTIDIVSAFTKMHFLNNVEIGNSGIENGRSPRRLELAS